MAFGLVVGAAAARQGLSFFQSMMMNFFVCSGIAQLVALEIWPARSDVECDSTITLLTAVRRCTALPDERLSMRPWFDQVPSMAGLHGSVFLTDADLVDSPVRSGSGVGSRGLAVYFGAASPMHDRLAGGPLQGIGYFIGRLHCRSCPVRSTS